MGINSKIAKMPFVALYLIASGLASFNLIRVILFQKDFEVFQTLQPWDYSLASFFIKNFGISHQQYYIFAFPIVLLVLYLVPKIFGKLMNLDKSSNIKGDNHVVFLIILFLTPSILGLHQFFANSWKGHIIPGIILIGLFSILSWMDEKT